MGSLEDSSNKKYRISKLQKNILRTVSSLGVLSVALLAPNTLKIFKPLIKKLTISDINSVNRARNKLIEIGLLARDKENHNYINITEKGSSALQRYVHETYILPTPKKWDGKWRLVIFDITERRKKTREVLRITLRNIGFAKLQNSVWIYPYPCEELVTLLKANLKIGYDLLYIIAEEIEGGNRLRKIFKLPAKTNESD